jgi:preprotein translocase subunit SecG
LTKHITEGIIRLLRQVIKESFSEVFVERYLDIAMIIISIALIASVILQSKGAGLGGLTGGDSGAIFTARRGVEKTLFQITVALSIIFFGLSIATVVLTG